MAESSRFSDSPGRLRTTVLAARWCQSRVSSEGGPGLDAPGLAQPLEGQRPHLLHALAALELLGLWRSDGSSGASFIAFDSRATPLSWKPSWAYSSATKTYSSTALSNCRRWV